MSSAKRVRLHDSLRLSPGRIGDAMQAASDSAERAAAGIWRREPSVWSTDPAVQQKIANRLGWLTSPPLMADAVPRLLEFADRVKRDGFTDVVLLGMGGSSLAPEVLRGVLGVAPGWPRFHMLDSTDPAAVLAASHTAAHDAVSPGQQVGDDDRAQLAGRLFSTPARGVGRATLGRSLRRDHRRGHRARSARTRGRLPRSLHQSRPTSAGAIRRCRFSASCRRR